VFEKYGVSATPTALILDKDGSEIDWLASYTPPADTFLERLQKSLRGEDTYRSLSAIYAKDPRDVETVFKLALKYDEKLSTQAKAEDLFKQVVALDPEGKVGTYSVRYPKAVVPYAEYAEYILARKVALGQKPDPAPMKAFIAKYAASPLVKSGYSYLGYYYGYQAPKDEATAFFEEYTARYPEDPVVLGSYVRRIIRDKEPIDKGLALAEKIKELTSYNPSPYDSESLAQLYALKGDAEKVKETFGPDYIGDQVTSLAYLLVTYSQFWLERGENLDSAEEMAGAARRLLPDDVYVLQTAASLYQKSGKAEKALEAYGPAYAAAVADKPSSLYSYGYFWNRAGTNLESAVEAVKRSNAAEPAYYKFDVLAQLLIKTKDYAGAVKAAEQALALAQDLAKKRPGFPTKPYEDRLKQAKEALAKGGTDPAKK
jgi:tetratricopeptide (TPR) repeat protein